MAQFMLPNEIWYHIFLYLDEKSLRNITSTCKLFFELIRGSEKLSGCIILKSVTLKDLATNIKNSEWIWDRWPSLKTLKIPLQYEYWDSTDRSTEREIFDLIRDMKFETCSTLEWVVVFNCCWSMGENVNLMKRFDGLLGGHLMEFSFHPKDIPLTQTWKNITVHICQICLIRYGNNTEKAVSNTELPKSDKFCKPCLDWCVSSGMLKKKEKY